MTNWTSLHSSIDLLNSLEQDIKQWATNRVTYTEGNLVASLEVIAELKERFESLPNLEE